MPSKPKYVLLLCFFLFSLIPSAQEDVSAYKNHFGFGASWQSEIGENANGFGMKVRYERGKGCLRFVATMETENMSYKNSNTTDESTHDNGSGAWRWRKVESHQVNVLSNAYSLGFVLRTQQATETVRVGIGFNVGYHQKIFRNFKNESCTITSSNYFGQMWQNPSSTSFPPQPCDAKQSVILANSFFMMPSLHFEIVLKNKSELDLSFGYWLPTQKLNRKIKNSGPSSLLKTRPLYQFKTPHSGEKLQTRRLSLSVIYFPNLWKKK